MTTKSLYTKYFNSSSFYKNTGGFLVYCSDDACDAVAKELYNQNSLPKIPMAFGLDLPEGGCIVLINETLRKCDDDVIEAIIYHEVGHITLGHLTKMKSVANSLSLTGSNDDMLRLSQYVKNIEFEADAYSFLLGKNIPKALTMMSDFGYDLSERLEALKAI